MKFHSWKQKALKLRLVKLHYFSENSLLFLPESWELEAEEIWLVNISHNKRWDAERGEGSAVPASPFAEPTLVYHAVFVGDVGIGAPDHHLVDVRRIFCSGNECGYASITPPQQRSLLKLQRLWSYDKTHSTSYCSCLLKETESLIIRINTGVGLEYQLVRKEKS